MRLVHSVRCACCLLALLALCALLSGRRSPVGAAAQGPQEDRPVEQVRKNIQVIKGLPASRLFEVMNFVSVSLGVRCDYCHVRKGTGPDSWVWESDEYQTKRTARRMMQMVLDTNKNNMDAFRGAGVTCYTCHQGNTKPLRSPSMPLTVSGHEGGAPAAATAAQPAAMPTAEQVLARYVEAVGGRAAVERAKTRVLKGTREASQNRSVPIEISMKAGKYLIVAQTPQGATRQGLDGGRAWLKGFRTQPGGTPQEIVREMSPAELATFRNSVLLSEPIKIGEAFPQMTFAGLGKVGERETYVLEHRPREGVLERLYFDRETGLLLRRKTFNDTVLFPVPEQYDFEDYRDVDGLKLPFTVRYSNIDTFFSYTRKFTEIRHNVPLDDALFSPPPQPTPTPTPKP